MNHAGKDDAGGEPRRLPPEAMERLQRRNDLQQQLLANIHARLGGLRAVIDAVDDRWVTEDLVYRFWHHSLKVYGLQSHTERIVAELEALRPDGCDLHPWFRTIVADGTGRVFELAHNKDWLGHARPIVEAFFHARFLLAMAVQAGETLDAPPNLLPSGWAALLELYGIR